MSQNNQYQCSFVLNCQNAKTFWQFCAKYKNSNLKWKKSPSLVSFLLFLSLHYIRQYFHLNKLDWSGRNGQVSWPKQSLNFSEAARFSELQQLFSFGLKASKMRPGSVPIFHLLRTLDCFSCPSLTKHILKPLSQEKEKKKGFCIMSHLL